MKQCLFCYYDRAAGLYSSPICSVNRPVAIRNFVAVMRDDANKLTAPDMELYIIGSFDAESAEIQLLSKPELVVKFSEYLDTPEGV